jgi:fatty acid desaturase
VNDLILRDHRLRNIQWKDLVRVSRWEIGFEFALPAAWLSASLVFAALGYTMVALPLSFVFFLTGLRLVHNAFHNVLGVSRRATSGVLWLLSIIMLGSMHAVRFNHLRHHRHLMNELDVEARSAGMTWYGALLFGPVFPILLHWTALREGDSRLRGVVLGQLVANALWLWLVLLILDVPALRYHVTVMAVGQCLTAFFAVWTVHHHCDRTHHIARTLRNRVKNRVTFNMFLHVEHHLFPRVPTCHLSQLSVRIDEMAPELKQKVVF